ncbi:glycosyltransferase family 39 protein [Kineosporia babensis]|uniref:Glycosyltransferase family 39 protein n=1 Tax=Kineosporia babensis TaxID=499548 RepID=A0A9X1ST16_9ACTN|nr:glycosyltransferase family 39 protein [Kineosporia babensis]MCD5311319.1 glycosyltransferase family 39 protein [Kineosporia babensis]
MALGQRGLGLISGLLATAFLGWGLARTAFWLDEGATVVATQRSWDDLWTLKDGPEAPLLPYYVLLKLFRSAARALAPFLSDHPELLLRLPSAVVTVLAVWILAAWLSRLTSAHLTVTTSVMLLLISGFSRYGQEARPYALVAFLAVVATVVWHTMTTDSRWRWSVLYAFTVSAMIVMHTLSAPLVGAHLLASVICLSGQGRWPVFWRTAVAGTVGALLASPLALLSSSNGTGPTTVYDNITPRYVLYIFTRLFTENPTPLLGIGPVILLALIGLVQVRAGQYQFVARLAAGWALVPLVAMIPVLIVYPNLLLGRYVVFVLPAWAILAGLGVTFLADAVSRRVSQRQVVAATVAVALILGTAVLQFESLNKIRQSAGHGEDIRPALEIAQRPEYRKLGIVVSTRFGSVMVGAYDREQEDRLVSQRMQRDQNVIWPAAVPQKEAGRSLRGKQRVILLQRARPEEGCSQVVQPVTPAEIEYCKPPLLKRLNFQVEQIVSAEGGWVFAVMKRQRVELAPLGQPRRNPIPAAIAAR